MSLGMYLKVSEPQGLELIATTGKQLGLFVTTELYH